MHCVSEMLILPEGPMHNCQVLCITCMDHTGPRWYLKPLTRPRNSATCHTYLSKPVSLRDGLSFHSRERPRDRRPVSHDLMDLAFGRLSARPIDLYVPHPCGNGHDTS
jgi:hypothetical protein